MTHRPPRRPPPPSAPSPGLSDLCILIDGPPVARGDTHAHEALADALRFSLDACARLGVIGNTLLTAMRLPGRATQQLAESHAARPALVGPEGHAPPIDALPRPFTLLLQPGVTPDATTLLRGLAALHASPRLAAITGPVHRADGAIETHVLPNVLHAGATLIRTAALRAVGGFSRLLAPGGAADLDLTCRLLRDGHAVQRFADFAFERPAWPAVFPSSTHAADTLRDALIVQERYLPRAHRRALRRDTIRLARLTLDPQDASPHLLRAMRDARRWATWEQKRGRSTLSSAPLEALLGWSALRQRVAAFAKDHNVRRVVFAGVHPHLFGFVHAAHVAGLTIDAVADDTHLANHDAKRAPQLRRIPILPMARAIRPATQAVVVTDLHPATAQRTAAAVAECFHGPILLPEESPNLPQIKTDSRSSQRAA